MQWVGKAVGGLLGLAAAGPFGSVVGLVLGHRFDQGSGGARGPAEIPHDLSEHFFRATFELMGRVAKADGRVSEEEIRVARRVMSAMALTPEQVTSAIEFFTTGKQPDYPLAERLTQLAARLGARHDVARAFVEIQMQAAIAAGAVDVDKRRLLWRIASELGIGRVELAQIEALIRAEQRRRPNPRGSAPELEEAYRVLGISPTASDTDVKRAYRRLMSQHHPDKLVAKGLPGEMTAIALKRTHEIRAAYERAKAHRGFK